MCMRIALVSYHPIATSADAETCHDLLTLRQYAVILVRHGLQVLWLTSAETATALADDVSLLPTGEDDLPETCRHVIPCQPYRFEGVRLLCVDDSLWQQRALHTRLYTFVRLLQRELSCAVLHTWGTFPAAYLGVYTARLLGLPAAVYYSQPYLRDGPQQSFVWHWVARHLTIALVSSHADQEYLLTTSDLTPARISVIDPALSTVGPTMVSLYQTLTTSSGA